MCEQQYRAERGEQEDAAWLESLESKYPTLRAMRPGKAPVKNIASALVAAQRQFGPALKTATNPHFRSRYADLSACVEAVIDGLNASGIALVQACHECPDGVIVETLFVHESGEQFSAGRLHVPAAKQDPQGYGSALTYARRYSLMAACGIAPEDDDGNAASRKGSVAASFRSSATMGAMDDVDPDRALHLKMIASIVAGKCAKGEITQAHAVLESERFDDTDKTAVWSLLDSKTRSALKKHGDEVRAKKQSEEAAA